MGIKVSVNTNKKATLKMYNSLGSFLFEQEYDELSNASQSQMKTLREAHKILGGLL